MIKMCLSMEHNSNSLSVHKKLQNLNITTSIDFGDIKNTTELLYAPLTSFLACIQCVSLILTILTLPQKFYKMSLYAAFVLLSLVCI